MHGISVGTVCSMVQRRRLWYEIWLTRKKTGKMARKRRSGRGGVAAPSRENGAGKLGSLIEQPMSDLGRPRRTEEPPGSRIRQARGPCRSRPRLILSISAYFGGSGVIPKSSASPALNVSSSTTSSNFSSFCFRSRSRKRAYARPLLGRKGQAFSRTTHLRYAVS